MACRRALLKIAAYHFSDTPVLATGSSTLEATVDAPHKRKLDGLEVEFVSLELLIGRLAGTPPGPFE